MSFTSMLYMCMFNQCEFFVCSVYRMSSNLYIHYTVLCGIVLCGIILFYFLKLLHRVQSLKLACTVKDTLQRQEIAYEIIMVHVWKNIHAYTPANSLAHIYMYIHI